MTFSIHHIW